MASNSLVIITGEEEESQQRREHLRNVASSSAKQRAKQAREEKVPTAAQDRLSEFEIIYGLQRAKLQPRE